MLLLKLNTKQSKQQQIFIELITILNLMFKYMNMKPQNIKSPPQYLYKLSVDVIDLIVAKPNIYLTQQKLTFS